MKSDELLQQTLELAGMPVKQYEYKGSAEQYIVYNEEDERAAYYADNLPQEMSIWWQVHIFQPNTANHRANKRKVRNLLIKAGFLIGDIETIYEQESQTIHTVISCNIEEDMEE